MRKKLEDPGNTEGWQLWGPSESAKASLRYNKHETTYHKKCISASMIPRAAPHHPYMRTFLTQVLITLRSSVCYWTELSAGEVKPKDGQGRMSFTESAGKEGDVSVRLVTHV